MTVFSITPPEEYSKPQQQGLFFFLLLGMSCFAKSHFGLLKAYQNFILSFLSVTTKKQPNVIEGEL
jgi:hypothetical protein